MQQETYEELDAALKEKARKLVEAPASYEPQAVYDVYHYFRLNRREANDDQRTITLERLGQEVADPAALAKEQARENRYFDTQQEIIDRMIDNAERETCQALGIPLPNAAVTERGSGDQGRVGQNAPRLRPDDEFIEAHTGGGNPALPRWTAAPSIRKPKGTDLDGPDI